MPFTEACLTEILRTLRPAKHNSKNHHHEEIVLCAVFKTQGFGITDNI